MMDRKRHKFEDTEPQGAAPSENTAEKDVAAEESEEAKLLGKLAQEHEQAVKERDEYLDLLQRSRAEFDNYRRRNNNVREDAYNDGLCDTVEKFLPVLDNLERAAAAEGGEKALREGVQLVLKQFITILSAMGVEEIEACKCAFDPNLHHAVAQEPAEGVESGCVSAVLQKGYRTGDRILRHCLVKVAE
jgi:molecular chaperone GrpE